MYQSWRKLLFLHWRFDPDVIQALLPSGLTVDLFDGAAWVAIVPFEMHRIRPRGLPALPWLSNFLELNVRTYAVNEQGTPGVWFFSLSANRKLAVDIARAWFRLPYWWSNMSTQTGEDEMIKSRCRRRADRRRRTHKFRYRPEGAVREAVPGTLEFFLIERYVLFAQRAGGRIVAGRVHHAPYRLQNAAVNAWDGGLLTLDGLPKPGRAPEHAAFSPGVDVEVFALGR